MNESDFFLEEDRTILELAEAYVNEGLTAGEIEAELLFKHRVKISAVERMTGAIKAIFQAKHLREEEYFRWLKGLAFNTEREGLQGAIFGILMSVVALFLGFFIVSELGIQTVHFELLGIVVLVLCFPLGIVLGLLIFWASQWYWEKKAQNVKNRIRGPRFELPKVRRG